MELKDRFIQLCQAHNFSEKWTHSTYEIIEKHYSEANRFYHNLTHIETMLNGAERLNLAAATHPVLYFSIWFHDIVYNSKKKDNEEKSAQMAVDFLSQTSLATTIIEQINSAIIHTKFHFELYENESLEEQLLLDLDLGILGTDTTIYEQYAIQVRKEYAWVLGPIYRHNRKKVLKKFLAMPQIYRTNYFQTNFEEAARNNIQSELLKL